MAKLDTAKKESADYAAHGFRIRFIGALVVIGALTVLSQIAVQWLLASQQEDVHVINVAGRQRMLGQQIVKTGVRLIGVGSTEARRGALDELREALGLLQRGHLGLQRGDSDQGLPGSNSAQVRLLFTGIESDYQAIVTAAGTILAASDRPGELFPAVQRLSTHEASFQAGMSEIVTQYESEARRRIAYARWLQFGFGLLTLLALFVVARKLLAPTMQRLQRDMQRHERHANEADKLFSASPTALFLVDAGSLAITRCNRKAEVLMGCPADDFVGQPFSAFFETTLDTNRKFLQKVRSGEIFDEHEVLLTDARHNVVDGLASLRQFAHANQRGYLIGITDITGVRAS
ncbi:MAG: type IV pili methyl-accepting chemotaxis transducer N-terminal domain-containing protein [Rhodocyclales bacterium]|nr:type IV pili methyl-accepting chemotaxis transducer N-terminal domain-containing protein [Rhodocyclales bacterium]